MRFTTKLSALITLLVALAMFLMLMGCSYSFFYVTQDRQERRFDSLVTSLDQAMLQESPRDQEKWLPIVMRPLGIVSIRVEAGTSKLLDYKLPTLKKEPWDALNGYRQVSRTLLQHPGSTLHITYLDPFASDVRTLQSTAAVTLSIVVMVVVLLFSLRWLREQADGEDRLERRARRILNGERENVMQGDVREWPANVSGALDRLLADLAEAREERSRVDTLIRAFAAQDAKTGLNNRLFFDNQLTTQLEDEGSHGIVMMVRLPDFETLRETHGSMAVQELMYSLVNLLSTFVMRYPSALLARYFHSDFTVLLPHRTLKEADGIASQLVNAIDALPSTALIDREAFLHIGIVAYRSGQTTEQVIDYAEQATRHATLQGENGWYVYDSQVPEKGRGSVKWRTLLEQVLARGGPRLYQKPAVTVEGEVHHDVDADSARRTQLQRGDRQDAGTAAEVDDGFARQIEAVQPLQTQRGGRVGAGAERQARIEHHVNRVGIGNVAPARADPQALTEAHRVEVVHPLALPVLVFQLFYLVAETGAQQRVLFQHRHHLGHIGFGVVEADHVGIAPQQGFTRQRFEHRVVVGVLEGHRHGAAFHQRVAQVFRLAAGGVQFELDPRHSNSL